MHIWHRGALVRRSVRAKDQQDVLELLDASRSRAEWLALPVYFQSATALRPVLSGVVTGGLAEELRRNEVSLKRQVQRRFPDAPRIVQAVRCLCSLPGAPGSSTVDTHEPHSRWHAGLQLSRSGTALTTHQRLTTAHAGAATPTTAVRAWPRAAVPAVPVCVQTSYGRGCPSPAVGAVHAVPRLFLPGPATRLPHTGIEKHDHAQTSGAPVPASSTCRAHCSSSDTSPSPMLPPQGPTAGAMQPARSLQSWRVAPMWTDAVSRALPVCRSMCWTQRTLWPRSKTSTSRRRR